VSRELRINLNFGMKEEVRRWKIGKGIGRIILIENRLGVRFFGL
jgi:hypothetical protein